MGLFTRTKKPAISDNEIMEKYNLPQPQDGYCNNCGNKCVFLITKIEDYGFENETGKPHKMIIGEYKCPQCHHSSNNWGFSTSYSDGRWNRIYR